MIAGIRFSKHGQIYYFSAEFDVVAGDNVVVETEQGKGFGQVCFVRDNLPQDEVGIGSLVPILRLATKEDVQTAEDNINLAQKALTFCKNCINERKLDMKLVDVEVFFDRSKVIFYFTAPARIDFRDLVKDLVREYRARIELRQIGVRHETQMVGAVGNCGMVCCCRRYLRKFAPVTIRMAKEQNLFLNPAKISGVCGRLLCCLSYEQENYDNFHNQCPKLGKKYQTSKGPMKVLRSNMFRNTISVLNEENVELEFNLDEWQNLNPSRPEHYKQTKIISKAGQKSNYHDELMVISMSPDADDDDFFERDDIDNDDHGLAEEESLLLTLEDNPDDNLGNGGIFGLAPKKNKAQGKPAKNPNKGN